jgi:hypothetical protein
MTAVDCDHASRCQEKKERRGGRSPREPFVEPLDNPLDIGRGIREVQEVVGPRFELSAAAVRRVLQVDDALDPMLREYLRPRCKDP